MANKFIKINGTSVKVLKEDSEYFYTSLINKPKFCFWLHSFRCAIPKTPTNHYNVELKTNWWNPIVWIVLIVLLISCLIWVGIKGVIELCKEIFETGIDFDWSIYMNCQTEKPIEIEM